MRGRWKAGSVIAAVFVVLLALASLSAAAQGRPPAQVRPTRHEQNAAVPPGVRLIAKMPPPGPPRAFHFPPVASTTLPNGVRVFVIPDHRLPLVTVALVLPHAGSLYDPPGLAGLATTTAGLLVAGTSTRTETQISGSLDSVGASISALADHDDATAAVTVLKKDVGLGLALLADVVLHPTFPAEALDRVRRRELSTLRARYADPAYLASAAFNRVVYAPGSYGVPTEGTPQSIARISRDDLVRFHRKRYVPAGALLALAGDVTPAEGFVAARRYFGTWSSPAPVAAPPAAPAAPRGLRIFVINRPGTAQTEIRVGRPAVARGNPHAVSLFVAGRIFAGGYDSLYNAAIRDNPGLVLNANSSLVSRRFAGSFFAAASTPAARTVPALRFVVAQIGRMSSGAFGKADLARARRYLIGAYPLQMEKPVQVLTRVLTAAASGLPADFNATYRQKIAAVTLTALRPVAARYYDTNGLDVLLVGDASVFRDALKKAYPSAAYREVSPGKLDLLQPELQRKAAVLPAPTPATLSGGRSVLEAAARAAGGQALAAVRTLRVSETGHVKGEQGTITIDETYQIAYPNRIHSELSILDQKLTEVLVGEQGWMTSGRRSAPLSLYQVKNLRRRVLLAEGIRAYQLALSGTAKVQWLGEERVRGRRLIALNWKTDTGPIKLYVDPTTHLFTGAAYTAVSTRGSKNTLELWSDFRTVSGLRLPFHMVGYQDGAKFMEATVKRIEVNAAVDPKMFIRPKSSSANPPKP